MQIADQQSTQYIPTFLDNKIGVLDVEGYVPRDPILHTGAPKEMLSKAFAPTMDIHATETIKTVTFTLWPHSVKVRLGNRSPFCTGNLVYLSLHLSVFGWIVNVRS